MPRRTTPFERFSKKLPLMALAAMGSIARGIAGQQTFEVARGNQTATLTANNYPNLANPTTGRGYFPTDVGNWSGIEPISSIVGYEDDGAIRSMQPEEGGPVITTSNSLPNLESLRIRPQTATSDTYSTQSSVNGIAPSDERDSFYQLVTGGNNQLIVHKTDTDDNIEFSKTFDLNRATILRSHQLQGPNGNNVLFVQFQDASGLGVGFIDLDDFETTPNGGSISISRVASLNPFASLRVTSGNYTAFELDNGTRYYQTTAGQYVVVSGSSVSAASSLPADARAVTVSSISFETNSDDTISFDASTNSYTVDSDGATLTHIEIDQASVSSADGVDSVTITSPLGLTVNNSMVVDFLSGQNPLASNINFRPTNSTDPIRWKVISRDVASPYDLVGAGSIADFDSVAAIEETTDLSTINTTSLGSNIFFAAEQDDRVLVIDLPSLSPEEQHNVASQVGVAISQDVQPTTYTSTTPTSTTRTATTITTTTTSTIRTTTETTTDTSTGTTTEITTRTTTPTTSRSTTPSTTPTSSASTTPTSTVTTTRVTTPTSTGTSTATTTVVTTPTTSGTTTDTTSPTTSYTTTITSSGTTTDTTTGTTTTTPTTSQTITSTTTPTTTLSRTGTTTITSTGTTTDTTTGTVTPTTTITTTGTTATTLTSTSLTTLRPTTTITSTTTSPTTKTTSTLSSTTDPTTKTSTQTSTITSSSTTSPTTTDTTTVTTTPTTSESTTDTTSPTSTYTSSVTSTRTTSGTTTASSTMTLTSTTTPTTTITSTGTASQTTTPVTTITSRPPTPAPSTTPATPSATTTQVTTSAAGNLTTNITNSNDRNSSTENLWWIWLLAAAMATAAVIGYGVHRRNNRRDGRIAPVVNPLALADADPEEIPLDDLAQHADTPDQTPPGGPAAIAETAFPGNGEVPNPPRRLPPIRGQNIPRRPGEEELQRAGYLGDGRWAELSPNRPQPPEAGARIPQRRSDDDPGLVVTPVFRSPEAEESMRGGAVNRAAGADIRPTTAEGLRALGRHGRLDDDPSASRE